MSAWKGLERRVAAALGGRRTGPAGAAVSDVTGVPWSVEVKRSSRPGPPVLSKWVEQARDQAVREGRKHEWLLVVAGHNDRRPIVCMDFGVFCELARDAGRIPTQVVDGGVEEVM